MNNPQKDFYEHYWRGVDGSGDTPTGAFSPELKRLILRSLPARARVLDAGCGDGAKYGDWLAANVGTYFGVDISSRAVDAAQRRGLDAHVIPDLAATDLDAGTFDACIAIEVLEHLVDPLAAVREMRRLVRPGGILIATVPNMGYWRYRLDFVLLGRFPGVSSVEPWNDPHVRFFTRRTIRAMFVEAGLDVVRVTGVNGSLFGDLPYVRRRFGTERISRPFARLGSVSPSLFGLSSAIVARNPRD